MRIAPAQNRPPREEGFVLIEVLVSALILAIVAAAVLAVLSATTRSAASERLRAQAVGLAQEDQARLRTMQLTKLNRLDQKREGVVLDGTAFTVRSQGTFVSSATNEVSCSEEVPGTDYVRITSSVDAPSMRTPVVLRSIVSPSNGSLDQNHGTISFRAKNAHGQPLSGVSFSGIGRGAFSGQTDSTGCANFADLPAGNYEVTITANGMINPKGESSTTEEIGAPTAGTQSVSLLYDVAGAVEPSFEYRIGASESLRPGSADSIMVSNAESGALPTLYGTPGGSRVTTFTGAGGLFPFTSNDVVYAGSCLANNPDPGLSKPANQKAMALVPIPAGGVATATIQLPALNLNLTYNGQPVSGARVTTTDKNCEFGSQKVKRVYSTEAAGHLARNDGTATPDAGMPWGEYEVCASAFGRLVKGTKKVEQLSDWATLDLELANGTTGSCP